MTPMFMESFNSTDSNTSISEAAATVHSDDFQIPHPLQQRQPGSISGEACSPRKICQVDLCNSEDDIHYDKAMVENDSRVPSVSSQASTSSTSSYNSTMESLNDQKPVHKGRKSNLNDDKGIDSRKKRELLETARKRYERELKRIAWESR